VGYDIDLFVPPESLAPARETLASLGYEPIAGTSRFPADHVPPMIRKTGWQWNGDYFEPGIPPCVDLHFRFWDQDTEGFPAPGVENFWARRIQQDGLPVLGRADRLAYSALHLLRHVFRGTPRPYHVYEIAYFLDTLAADDSFWNSWREIHPPALRRLEAIAFRLARAWFGCRPHRLRPKHRRARRWHSTLVRALCRRAARGAVSPQQRRAVAAIRATGFSA
jgi:hypothetical protein